MTTPSPYWLPHTSSVDFCEPNYLLTDVAVEPWNAASSLIISLFGLIGILYSNPMKESQVTMLYTLLIIIGFGSTALHASLHWFAQSLDELPMLWFNVYVLYFLSVLHTPRSSGADASRPAHDCDIEAGREKDSERNSNITSSASDSGPASERQLRSRERRIATALSLFAVVVTYIYYNLQAFYGVFVGGYICTVFAVFVWTFSLIFLSQEVNTTGGTDGHSLGAAGALCYSMLYNEKSSSPQLTAERVQISRRMTREAKTCLKGVLLVFGGIGFSCWLVDMHMCQALLPHYTQYSWGMTLHVIWHLGAAYGGYLQVQTLIILRAQAMNVDLHLQWPSLHLQAGGVERLLGWLCLPVLSEHKSLQKSKSSVSSLGHSHLVAVASSGDSNSSASKRAAGVAVPAGDCCKRDK